MTKKPATAVTARATTDIRGLLMLLALSPPCLLLELELELVLVPELALELEAGGYGGVLGPEFAHEAASAARA